MSGFEKLAGQMLKQGAAGEVVKELQAALTDKGLDVGKIDGVFGEKTLAAVKAFQQQAGLEPDGVVGPKTLLAVKEMAEAKLGGADSAAAKAAVSQIAGAVGGLFGKR
mgnify:CR=1 FL=1